MESLFLCHSQTQCNSIQQIKSKVANSEEKILNHTQRRDSTCSGGGRKKQRLIGVPAAPKKFCVVQIFPGPAQGFFQIIFFTCNYKISFLSPFFFSLECLVSCLALLYFLINFFLNKLILQLTNI